MNASRTQRTIRYAQLNYHPTRVITALCRYPMNKPPHSNEATRRKPLGAIGCLAMMVLGVIFSASAIRTTPPSAKRYQCQNNLKQIALAILNYDSANGHLPPLMSLAEDGTPLHSWRIHILPFLEETDLYEKIDLNLPWNHPANLALQDDMPTVYAALHLAMKTIRLLTLHQPDKTPCGWQVNREKYAKLQRAHQKPDW